MVAHLQGTAEVASIEEVIWSRDGEATVDIGEHLWPAPFDITVLGFIPTAGDAPTGADLIFDPTLLGTTMFTTQANRPRVLAGQNVGATAVPDVVDVDEGQTITMDIDQPGSVDPGDKIDVKMLYRKRA